MNPFGYSIYSERFCFSILSEENIIHDDVIFILKDYEDIEMIRRNGETFFYKKDEH